MQRKGPYHGFADNKILDIFYNGLTKSSRSYLDSCSWNIFRERTIFEAKELLETIANNYQDWNIEEDEEIKILIKKRGILALSEETMKEANKTIKEKGIKTFDLKELSEKGIKFPVDEPCFPIQVHYLRLHGLW